MSTATKPRLKAVRSPRRLRSVELAKKQATVGAWELADAVYEDVLDELQDEAAASSAEHGVNTGLKAAEEKVAKEHEKAKTEVGQNYLHNLFVARRVWPPEERLPEVAGFNAHFELRGKDFKNRRAILERLAKKSDDGWVTRNAVRIYKSERKPPQRKTFLQLVEERVRGSVKGAAAPWHLVTEDDRQAIAQIVIRIGREVADGTFPTKAKT